MGLFAIGDLHLPGGQEKPMDIFGDHWEDHFTRISQDWRQRVKETDVVLIPGDISWAMQLADAKPDLEAIGALPGRKVILRGNHDYWWSGITQVRGALPEGMYALQNDALAFDCCVVCGSRGWVFPTPEAPLSPEDEKIYRRELLRLEMSLSTGQKLRGDRPLVLMMHYPPLTLQAMDTGFTQLAERYGVALVVYGHLHGPGIRWGFHGEYRGVRYRLTSCDALGFQLTELQIPS